MRVHVLGQSLGGRDLYRVEITDPNSPHPLDRLYYESELLAALRDRGRAMEGCAGCEHEERCGGGLRCLAYAVTGNAFRKDPGCWL